MGKKERICFGRCSHVILTLGNIHCKIHSDFPSLYGSVSVVVHVKGWPRDDVCRIRWLGGLITYLISLWHLQRRTNVKVAVAC